MADKKAVHLFKRLKKLQVQQRVEAANDPRYGRGLLSFLSSLTPTQYAELFPKWYLSSLPDVSGFRAALTKKSQTEQQETFESIDRRLSGADGKGRYEDNRGAASKTEMMKYAMDQLRKEGVPEANLKAAAAHLVGQAYMESGLNPNLKHDNNTGYGIYGARLERRDKMFGWLSQNGYANNSAEGQMRYMAHEAMNDKTYSVTRNILMNASQDTFERDAAGITANFERPLVNNYRAGAVKAAFSSYGGEEAVPVQPTPPSTNQNAQTTPTVQPQPVVGEVPPPVERMQSLPSIDPNAEGGVAFMSPAKREKKETATVEKPRKKDRQTRSIEPSAPKEARTNASDSEEVGASTPAFAGGGKGKVRGTATITRLDKKHRGDTAVIRDTSGEEFTVNPEKENITIDKSGNVDVKPVDHREDLGFIAAKHEGRGDVGTMSSGKGDRGGPSYGRHQLSSYSGSLKEYLDSPEGAPYAKHFEGLNPSTRKPKERAAFNSAYAKVVQEDPVGFSRSQQEFIARTHYDPVFKQAESYGYNVNDPRVQEALYSMSVQHRKKSSQILNNPKTLSTISQDPATQAATMYDVRKSIWRKYSRRYNEEKQDVANIDMSKYDKANVTPKQTAEAPGPTPESTVVSAPGPTPESTVVSAPKPDLGDKVRQIAGLSVRSVARQEVPVEAKQPQSVTPGSINVSSQPAPVIGPSRAAAESVNIPQTPGPTILPVSKIDTKTIAPSPTTHMDLLREEMRSGFESITPPTQETPPRHVRANKPVMTEMPPDLEHQNMMSTLSAAAKDPYGGVPSLERAVKQSGFNKERPWGDFKK